MLHSQHYAPKIQKMDPLASGARTLASGFRNGLENAKDEYVEDVGRDFRRAGQAFEKRGLAAGVLETLDAIDPIRQSAHLLDAAGILPDGPVAKNIYTAALRLSIGGPAAHMLALKDAFDIHRAARHQRVCPSHWLPSPALHYRETCCNPKRRPLGYMDSCPIDDFSQFSRNFVIGLAFGALSKLGPGGCISGAGAHRGSRWQSTDNLDGAGCFEDYVAAFMVDVIKHEQRQANQKMAELKSLSMKKKKVNCQKAVEKIASQLGKSVGSAIGVGAGGMLGMGFGSMIGEQCGKLIVNASFSPSKNPGELLKSASDKKGELEDSRAIKMEELKNIMNRLQQMLQALSAVLKVMHDGAMSSIRNIR